MDPLGFHAGQVADGLTSGGCLTGGRFLDRSAWGREVDRDDRVS
jgi:hypothetical protein